MTVLESMSVETATICAALFVTDPDGDGWEALGTHPFRVPPRVGDLIEREMDGVAYLFQVVAFIHPSRPARSAAGEILAIRLGRSTAVLKTIGEDARAGQMGLSR